MEPSPAAGAGLSESIPQAPVSGWTSQCRGATLSPPGALSARPSGPNSVGFEALEEAFWVWDSVGVVAVGGGPSVFGSRIQSGSLVEALP